MRKEGQKSKLQGLPTLLPNPHTYALYPDSSTFSCSIHWNLIQDIIWKHTLAIKSLKITYNGRTGTPLKRSWRPKRVFLRSLQNQNYFILIPSHYMPFTFILSWAYSWFPEVTWHVIQRLNTKDDLRIQLWKVRH